ncbi:MAG: hypothetical protein KAR38_09660 [Calditrichia bacterium]|nr:hypothetical protein [Calditrichia bacterium]
MPGIGIGIRYLSYFTRRAIIPITIIRGIMTGNRKIVNAINFTPKIKNAKIKIIIAPKIAPPTLNGSKTIPKINFIRKRDNFKKTIKQQNNNKTAKISI